MKYAAIEYTLDQDRRATDYRVIAECQEKDDATEIAAHYAAGEFRGEYAYGVESAHKAGQLAGTVIVTGSRA